MPSGLQDLLKIIDMGYEAEQRSEDRQVQTTLALLESSARRMQQKEAMALRSEKYAFEKGAKLLEVAHDANEMTMTKLSNSMFSDFGGGSFDPTDVDSKTGTGYYKELLKAAGMNVNKNETELDKYGVEIYNAIIGYATQPEAYRDKMLDLGEGILEMDYTQRNDDGSPKAGSKLEALVKMGVVKDGTFKGLQAIPVARANERDIAREVLEFSTGDFEIQSPIGIRTYEDVFAAKIADQFEQEDVFDSLNQIEFASLLESMGRDPDRAKKMASLHSKEGVSGVNAFLAKGSMGRSPSAKAADVKVGEKRYDPVEGVVYEIISVPDNTAEGKYLIRDVDTNKEIRVPSYIAGQLELRVP
jgi:hypothetical protein